MRNFFVVLLLTTIVCLLVVESSAKPELLIYPNQSYIIAPVKQSFTLVCEVKSGKKKNYAYMKWSPVDRESNTYNVTKVKSMRKLTFSNPSIRDSGKYRCEASVYQSFYQALVAEVTIQFYEPIAFKDCPGLQKLILGNTGRIDCTAVANPMPTLSWKKDGRPINSERITVGEDFLDITSVTEEDMGVYTVEAFVKETGKNLLQIIHVKSPPVINDIPEEVTIIHGRNNTIKCGVTGSEPLTYTWYNDFHQDMSHGLHSDGHEVHQGVLTVSKVTRFIGEYYICEVSNPVGRDQATVKIKVQRSELCEKGCDGIGFLWIRIPETKEDLEEICTTSIESMKCEIQRIEDCDEFDVALDTSLPKGHEIIDAIQETYCNEDTLFHAVLLENLECFKRISSIKQLTGICSPFNGTVTESIVQKLVEVLEKEGLVSLADYGNDRDKLHHCIKLLSIYGCNAVCIKQFCKAIPMYIYEEIIQKVDSKYFSLCPESFHLLPDVVRLLEEESNKYYDLSNHASVNSFF